MDNIGVVGTSYRTASVEALAEATLPSDFQPGNFNELAHLAGFSEFVYLGTCNRVEFYFRGENRIHTNPLLFHLRRSLAHSIPYYHRHHADAADQFGWFEPGA